MANLDWLVCADWFPTETATFWKAPDMDPAKIQTEVYFLPAALIYEKIGSISNSGRWVQWRQQGVLPPGEAKSDFEIIEVLFDRIRSLYQKEGGVYPDPILKANMDYKVDGKYDLRAVCWAINGYTSRTASSCRATLSFRLTVRLPAACGSTRATTTTKPTSSIR